MQVVTPISSTSGVVVAGSQTVGGNIGSHRSPCSSVNGPHFAVPNAWLAGTQMPLRSLVPSPQSTPLQLAASGVSRTRRAIWAYIGLLEVDVVLTEVGEHRHLGGERGVAGADEVDVVDSAGRHRRAPEQQLRARRVHPVGLGVDRVGVGVVERVTDEELRAA